MTTKYQKKPKPAIESMVCRDCGTKVVPCEGGYRHVRKPKGMRNHTAWAIPAKDDIAASALPKTSIGPIITEYPVPNPLTTDQIKESIQLGIKMSEETRLLVKSVISQSASQAMAYAVLETLIDDIWELVERHYNTVT